MGKFANYKRRLTLNAIANFDKEPPKVEEWETFLDSLPKEKDMFTLSLNKYKCRMYYFDWKYKVIANIGAFFELFKIHISSLLNKENKNNDDKEKNKEKLDMLVLEREVDPEDVFPNELYKEFPNNKKIETKHNSTIIKDEDLKTAYKTLARKNLFKFEYKLLALKELALHSDILSKYDFKAVVVYINERNSFSPILKEIYEKKNKEFISFMHGENLFQLIKSYMSFTRYYIWDKDQIDMFKNDMHCNIDKYVHYVPRKLSRKYELKNKYEKDLTYYISATSKKALANLAEITENLKTKGKKLVVRAHPRMTDMEHLKSIFNDENIESFDVKTPDSIENSEYIVGTATTVVTEAFYGGKKILIDDVTDREEFESLKSRKYLMLEKLKDPNVKLFSKYLKEIEEK